MKILFLCSGNIHRSPLAEALLRAEILREGRTDIEVSSAGTLALAGMPAVDEAATLAREAGCDLSEHRARPATPEALAAADLIVAMERYHRDWVEARHPDAAGRCRLLSEHAGPDSGIAPGDDVPDAIGEDLASFRRSFRIIRACVARLSRELPPPAEEVYTRAIEERFRARRGSPLTLSPADYDLLDRWWRRGVPLWLITGTIDELVGRKEGAGDSGRVRRLSYCEEAVDLRFESLRKGQVAPAAGPGPRPETTPGDELLRIAAERLRTAACSTRAGGFPEAAELLEGAARVLLPEAGAPPCDPAAARLRLHSLDETLVEALRGATAGEDLATLSEEAESSLAEHKSRMTPSAFEATVRRLVGRRLREIYGVPDLV